MDGVKETDAIIISDKADYSRCGGFFENGISQGAASYRRRPVYHPHNRIIAKKGLPEPIVVLGRGS